MRQDALEVKAAQQVAAQTAHILAQAPSYQQLDPTRRATMQQDLQRIQQALAADPLKLAKSGSDPYALSLASPAELTRLRMQATQRSQQPQPNGAAEDDQQSRKPRAAATETLAARTGALVDEIDFPGFVASLIHGAFDAIVDASIRQMEAYADLVSAVAKDVDRFTSDNVTTNQVRDWLVERFPSDIRLDLSGSQPQLRAKPSAEGDARSPAWLEDYGLAGEELSDELLEDQLIPLARRRIGEQRLQTLATMVLLGMNRIVIQDGTISAKVRFRAAARDRAQVDYAQSSDPGGVGGSWGSRGNYNQASMMVSTVGANVQADTELKAELFGEVKINFASETLPLENFADAAQMLLVQRHARQPALPLVQQPPAQPQLPPAQQLPPAAPPAPES
ncbi:MAG: hypothetical protein KDJ52_02355 [Anaerolineae bacterium]|nr:hypothetical protein [Anaerolineae bacterium]